MLKIQLLLSVLVLYNFENSYCKKICGDHKDCMTIPVCPEAQRLAPYRKSNQTINKIFISAICGSIWIGKTPAVQVCCSDFGTFEVQTPTVGVRSGSKLIQQEENEEIDLTKHDSVKLLPKVCGVVKYEERIVGGEAASIYEFPWMALIAFFELAADGTKIIKFGCGGTIINSRYILTAAHCVDNKPIEGIRLGEYDTTSVTDCQGEFPSFICEDHLQDVAVEKEIVHENYQNNPMENDIALLRVKEEINFTFKNVHPICLPLYKELIKLELSGKYVTVVGWGTTEYGQVSTRPLKVSVPVLTGAKCEESLRKKTICAGGDGKDSCKGDSGGPLMHIDEYDTSYRTIQYGIVSRGPGLCKNSPNPGIYTDVRRYMRWILDHIEE